MKHIKQVIREWLEMPHRQEIKDYIDSRVQRQATRHYNKLRKSDRDRYKQFVNEERRKDT